ncbi:hypothetical protein [Cupriavidus basilensis]|uniref:Uncharacterized protein n=1 Tax=Cupriavidus basilensis TaxID=68895 RepID=A0A643FTP3_9BURK|nr:hypothetical protein [Cupriavidus basilensis]QOT82201.1 hypothetical protein F7R26_039510 [Cupriavidus basilensis]
MAAQKDNGEVLRELIEQAQLTQEEALTLVNEGQAFPIALSTWKSYLAAQDSRRRRNCPEVVIRHAERVLSASGATTE